MLFNSYEFIGLFLPITAVVFFLIGRTSRAGALGWLTMASLFFYAWWRPLNVLIIAPSIAVNFFVARRLQALGARQASGQAKAVLAAGIVFNVVFLGYFKYAGFATTVSNDLFGTKYVLEQIVLPLGISFITFQKIAFLVDTHAGRIGAFTLREYCLFVLFFPQLVAGPIVHFRELMPQFARCTCRFEARHVAVGLSLFVVGLFKKVYVADTLAPLVGGIFQQASSGQALSLVPAWAAALGFTLQIYFDFSGYTDMALGAARIFGITLPPNFDSPLKSSSIIDFWLRWHMSLTRFLTAYVYNPLALALTRRRLAAGKKAVGGRHTTPGAFVQLVVLPTMVTMIVSGIWHGAGYLFIIWGVMHGVFLSVNHGWRILAARAWRGSVRYERIMGPVGFGLTALSVVVSMVVFRAPTVSAAGVVFRGMLGGSGIEVPAIIAARLGPLMGTLGALGITPSAAPGNDLLKLAFWVVVSGGIALLCPSSLQLLRRDEPALAWRANPDTSLVERMSTWQPSLVWAAAISLVAALGLVNLGGQSEFLYWQF